MTRIIRILNLALASLSIVLVGSDRATAQAVIVAPARVSYYYAPPAVTYYTPSVVYTPATSVSYYVAPVSYYTPAVTYYAPQVAYYSPVVAAPVAVTTTRYGLFGRPRVSATYYYPR
jgi:hypothetical protein